MINEYGFSFPKTFSNYLIRSFVVYIRPSMYMFFIKPSNAKKMRKENRLDKHRLVFLLKILTLAIGLIHPYFFSLAAWGLFMHNYHLSPHIWKFRKEKQGHQNQLRLFIFDHQRIGRDWKQPSVLLSDCNDANQSESFLRPLHRLKGQNIIHQMSFIINHCHRILSVINLQMKSTGTFVDEKIFLSHRSRSNNCQNDNRTKNCLSDSKHLSIKKERSTK